MGRGVIHDSHEGETFFTWHNRTDQVHSVLLKKFLNSLAFAQCLVTYHHWYVLEQQNPNDCVFCGTQDAVVKYCIKEY